MSGLHNSSVDTVNAAAAAIESTESRILQVTAAQRARRKSWFSSYWCFGSHKITKRIGHAVLAPEPAPHNSSVPTSDNLNQPPPLIHPFAVPPSSPASFLQSEAASISHSPGAGATPFSPISTNSMPGPLPAFTVGPYAHETQLVTPPVFSALTTEPSTAPLTPPPETLQMTTPPSPEVPFARLLTSEQYPGSDTSRNLSSEGTPVRRYTVPPRVPRDHQAMPVLMPVPPQVDFNHRVSFELTPEDVARCLQRKSTVEPVPILVGPLPLVDETYHDLPEKIRYSLSLPTNKEFKFESAETKASFGSEIEAPRKSWSFFPMLQQSAGG
jgi:hypothetical protein